MERSILLSLVLLVGLWGSAPLSAEEGYDEPMKMKDVPSPQVPLHPEWFTTDYNETRDLTRIQTKEDLGPGNPLPCTHGEAMKMDALGILEGKFLVPGGKFTAKLYFHRMAGLARNSDGILLKGHDRRFQPFDQDSKRLLIFEDETSVYFMTASGQRFSEEGDDVGHETQISKGSLGEVYLWETVTARLSWDELRRLKDGGRVSIGDRQMTLKADQISLIRSLIAVVEGLGS